MRFMRQNESRNGFTLMELLTVMAIMGILLTAGVASYFGARRGAEMRGAVGSIRAALTTARQHAVTRRRSTAMVFRLETTTNVYYIFEKNGEATKATGGAISELNVKGSTPPLSGPEYWPSNGAYIINFDANPNGQPYGQIARLNRPGTAEYTQTTWDEDGPDVWEVGDSYGLQIMEKGYLPPGIKCEVANDSSGGGMIRFYPNGKSSGMEPVSIVLIDKMNTAVKKELWVYPLLGLVKEPTP